MLNFRLLLTAILCNCIAYVLFVVTKSNTSFFVFFEGLLKEIPTSLLYLLPFLLLPLLVQIPFLLVFYRLNSFAKVIAVVLFLMANVCISYYSFGPPNFDGGVAVFRIMADLVLLGLLIRKSRFAQSTEQ